MWRRTNGMGSLLLFLTLLFFITLATANHHNNTDPSWCHYKNTTVGHGEVVLRVKRCCLHLVCCNGTFTSHFYNHHHHGNKDLCHQRKPRRNRGCCRYKYW